MGTTVFSRLSLLLLLLVLVGGLAYPTKSDPVKPGYPATVEAAGLLPDGFRLRIPVAAILPILELGLSEPFPIWKGQANVAPNQPSAFLRDERVELSLGRILPASPKDRETIKISPAIEAEEGFLALAFGWRAHKQMLWQDHFSRGTYRCKAKIALNQGQPEVEIQDGRFHLETAPWQRTLFAPVLWAAEQGASRAVEQALEKSLNKAIKSHLALIPYKERLKLEIEPGAFVFISN